MTGLNPYGAVARIFRNGQVNTMAADDPAPCVARPSAAVLLILHDKHAFVFCNEQFHVTMPSKCCEMIVDTNIHFFSVS